MISEPCFEGERTNMAFINYSLNPLFCMHLPFIHDIGVLIPFIMFEVEFPVIANVASSQIMPHL